MFRIGLRRVIAGAGLFAAGALCLSAQTNSLTGTNAAPGATGPQEEVLAEPPDRRPFSITGEFGTTGAGGNLSWRFMDHLGLRAGGDYFSVDPREHDRGHRV